MKYSTFSLSDDISTHTENSVRCIVPKAEKMINEMGEKIKAYKERTDALVKSNNKITSELQRYKRLYFLTLFFVVMLGLFYFYQPWNHFVSSVDKVQLPSSHQRYQ